MVNDEARQGALRFRSDENGPFLAANSSTPIPPLVGLPRLLSASESVIDDKDNDEDLRLLLAPGSSLGGARPKASVRDRDGMLAIAKFPHRDDEIQSTLWESLALSLAKKSGISVPEHRIEKIGNTPVLLLRRFDRQEKGPRIPFLSAMSMLSAHDNETRSYLEIADALTQYGAAPEADRKQLWRRIVFNIMISNTDDHLRNHGFLHSKGRGWHLSPAYDLNPVPADIKPRILTTAIDLEDTTASLELAFFEAEYFGLGQAEAKEIAKSVAAATADWRKHANRIGIPKPEIERMASAFEHDDRRMAEA